MLMKMVVLTGKGMTYGGSLIRPEATGFGTVYYGKEVLAHFNDTYEGKNKLLFLDMVTLLGVYVLKQENMELKLFLSLVEMVMYMIQKESLLMKKLISYYKSVHQITLN